MRRKMKHELGMWQKQGNTCEKHENASKVCILMRRIHMKMEKG